MLGWRERGCSYSPRPRDAQVKFVCKLQHKLFWATSHFPLHLCYIIYVSLYFSLILSFSLLLFFVTLLIFFHASPKSVKVVVTGPGTPPFLSLPAIGQINIFSRGASKWGWGGCWRELGGGQWPLMIICSLLEHPANAFISRLSA